MRIPSFAMMFLACCPVIAAAADAPMQRLTGRVVDAQSGDALPARVYMRSAEGKWHFPKSVAAEGSAVEYRKERQAGSVEMHTTLSAHPFVVDLPSGKYTITAERGKEYQTFEQEVTIADKPLELRIPLRRWVN